MQVIWYRRKAPPTHIPLRYDLLAFDRRSETLWLPEFLPVDDVMGLVDRALGDDVIDLYNYDEILWEVRRGPYGRNELDVWCGWMDHPMSRAPCPRQWPEDVAPFGAETDPSVVRSRVLDARLLEEDPLDNPHDESILAVWVLLQTYSPADAFVVDPTTTGLVRHDGTPVLRLDYDQNPIACVPERGALISSVADWRWVSWVQLLTFRRLAEADKLTVPERSELRIGVTALHLEPVSLVIPVGDGWPQTGAAEGVEIEIRDLGIGRMEPRIECNHLRYRQEDELLRPYYPEHLVLDWAMHIDIPGWLPVTTDGNPFFAVEALCKAGLRPEFALIGRSGAIHDSYFMSTCFEASRPTTVTGECHFLSLPGVPNLSAVRAQTARPHPAKSLLEAVGSTQT